MIIGLLEDDDAQASLLRAWLEDAGFTVSHAARCDTFLQMFEQSAFDAAILDWQLPDSSGIEVLKTLRTTLSSKIPIIFSTQRNTEDDIVEALRAGADDYLTKPVRHAELLARLSAVLRRAGISDRSDVITIGPIELDSQNETIKINGKIEKTTRKDFLVAQCLFQNFGKVLSREYLLKTVWGIDSTLDTRTVDVHVSRVRRSLGINPTMGYSIKTIYQHGYRLEKLNEN